MALSYLTDINLNKNELQNAVIQKLATDPSSGQTAGWIIFNTTDNQLKVYSEKQISGSDEGWINVGGDITGINITAGTGLTGTVSTTSGQHTQTINLANTAVTPASYGSATSIPTFTVDAQGRLTAAGSASITTTLTIDGDSTTQDVSLAADDLKIIGTANEIETAVTKSGTDVSLTIGLPNDVTIGNDLTVLGDLQVTGTTTTNNVETVSTSNGIIFEGTVADAHEGTLLAGALTADVTYTLPDKTGTVAMTSDITDRFYAASIGDGSATSYAVTHNLGSQDVIVQLYDASSLDTVFADVVRTSTSVVTIDFAVAPTTNDIRVLVTKIA
jgi:hypothetical protein